MKKSLLYLLFLFIIAQPIRADTLTKDFSSEIKVSIGFTENPDLSQNKKPDAASFKESEQTTIKNTTLPKAGEVHLSSQKGTLFIVFSLILFSIKILSTHAKNTSRNQPRFSRKEKVL